MTDQTGLKLVDLDESGVDRAFRSDVLSGLREGQKAIPARWLYDDAGSQLYEDITQVPEYYPARAETQILQERGADFADAIGPGRAVVEFGSGSSVKTPALLSAIDPAAYVPLDIAGDFLRAAAAASAATASAGALVTSEFEGGKGEREVADPATRMAETLAPAFRVRSVVLDIEEGRCEAEQGIGGEADDHQPQNRIARRVILDRQKNPVRAVRDAAGAGQRDEAEHGIQDRPAEIAHTNQPAEFFGFIDHYYLPVRSPWRANG